MTAEIPTNEPQEIIAGDTLKWNRDDISDYLASDGWALSYVLINATNKITINASANGAGYSVNVAAGTTAAYTVGTYQWKAFVTKASERFKVDEGTIEVVPNFAVVSTYDSRSHAKKVLDAINAVIENRASVDQESYTIMGRSLKRTPMEDLLKLKDKYQALYNSEQNAENVRNGAAGKNKILVRF